MFIYPPIARGIAAVLFFCTIFFNPLSAQEPSIQDCLGAIPVCQQIYEETNAPIGNGNVFDFVSEDNCTEGENNSIWYTFTVDNSGQFGFLLTPNNPDQDYDWILFDITNADCVDIQTDSTLIVSCNAAGKGDCQGPTGATGDTDFNNQGPNCGNTPPTVSAGFSPFNDLIDVQAGNTYALCIINFSANLSEGYVLDFGLSAGIGIFDEIPPTLDEVSYPESCNGALFSLQFSEFIQCATLSAANFQISGTGGPYNINLTSANCDAGGTYSKTFNFQVDPPIPFEGQMQLEMTVDGVTEALDLCGNPAASASLNFGGPTLTEELDLGPDTTICAGNSLILDSDFAGSYFWSDGSNGPNLEVTGSGTYWLTIITPCGETSDTIDVVVAGGGGADGILGPDTTICPNGTLLLDASAAGGTYLWQDGSTEPTFLVSEAGTFSVDITNECGNFQDDITVSLADPIAAMLPDTAICPGGTVLLEVTTPGATYLWQDGSTDSTFSVTSAGDYAVTITNACESLELSNTVTEKSGEAIAVDFGADTTLCTGASLLLQVDAPNAEIVWQDGSGDANFLVDQAGTYSVRVSNECGVVEDEITVQYAEPIALSLSDTSICTGETVIFDLTLAGADYLWQDGSTDSVYTVSEPGTYSVTVTNACESVELSAEVSNSGGEAVSVELGADTTLCTGETLLLQVDAPNAEIIWQDGSGDANFLVDQAGTYSVSVSSECGVVEDEITVQYAEPIALSLSDTSICTGETVIFDLTLAGADYLWQDGSTDSVYTVSEPGTYSVTVTNACESVELSAQVTDTGGVLPDINLGGDTLLCPGESLNLSLDIPDVDFSWQDGSTGSSFLVNSPGDYSVTITNECGSKSAEIRVNMAAPISVSLPADTVLCPGDQLILDVSDPNAIYYSWQDGSSDPVYQVTESGPYSVEVGNNCESVTANIQVEKCESCEVYIPSAFSPNGDGLNDNFEPYFNCQTENVHFSVFNRWGVMVYESSTLERGWDGTYRGQMVSEGVYIYNLQMDVFENGTSRRAVYTGDITVVK